MPHRAARQNEPNLRRAVVAKARWMNATGLNQGTSGNISARCGERMLITPSATPYDKMTAASIAAMPLDGDGASKGPLKPSTEWRMHRDIYRARPDVNAVVHTHSTFATALSMTRKPIPACHYMVAAFGGSDVRCAGYATFGTQALSDEVLAALDGRNACLIANHGMVAAGADLDRTMWLAVELETVARQYLHSLSIGGPLLLSAGEMEEACKSFEGYGVSGGMGGPAPKANGRRRRT